MGIKLAGVDVSGIVAKEIGQGVLRESEHEAILHKVTAGTRTGNLTGGTNPTETDSDCKAFIDSQNRESIGGTLVEDGDIIVVVIGDTITPTAVPESEDKFTIEGAKYQIKAVDRDPAAATYTLMLRSV